MTSDVDWPPSLSVRTPPSLSIYGEPTCLPTPFLPLATAPTALPLSAPPHARQPPRMAITTRTPPLPHRKYSYLRLPLILELQLLEQLLQRGHHLLHQGHALVDVAEADGPPYLLRLDARR